MRPSGSMSGVWKQSMVRLLRHRQTKKRKVCVLRSDPVLVKRLAKPFDAADEPQDPQAESDLVVARFGGERGFQRLLALR